MTQIHFPPKFPEGLTIRIQQNDGLVHLGEFGINDFLDPGDLWIIHSLINIISSPIGFERRERSAANAIVPREMSPVQMG